MPAFTRDGAVAHDYFWWFHETNRAIRVGDWKLVADHANPWELYDLSKDRSETKDVAWKNPAKVRELEAEWQKRTAEIRALAISDGKGLRPLRGMTNGK